MNKPSNDPDELEGVTLHRLSVKPSDGGWLDLYLLDFGSALGSAAVGPRDGWEGYEALVEAPGEIGKRALSFGDRKSVV